MDNVQIIDNTRIQWRLLVTSLIFFAALVGYQQYSSYQTISAHEQQQLITQSRVIRENVEHQLESTDLALLGIVKDLPFLMLSNDSSHINHRLSVLSDAMPGIRTMIILDRSGTMIAANREELVGKNVSNRDYYQIPLHTNEQTSFYISPPFKSILGNFVLNLSRIISASNGDFNGVVTAALEPEYFKILLSSVRYAPDMTCSITHGDGLRFMIVPEKAELAGESQNTPGSFFARHVASNKQENLFIGKSVSTGEENMTAIQSVRVAALNMNKPLYIFVSRRLDAIYADWYRALLGSIVLMVTLCSSSIVGLHFFQRRQRLMEIKANQAQKLIKLRLNLLEYAALHDSQNLLRQALDEVCTLSSSSIGFYHFVESDQQTLSLQAWSTRTLKEFCTAEGHGLHYSIKDAGVWADCIRQRQPIIHNDYASLPNRKGLPQGHAPVVRELVVPILRAERVVAILGIGNKSSDYTDDDVELVTYLADVVWEITERKRSEEVQKQQGIRYQMLQDVSRDGIHILDQDGNLVESNAAFRGMLGYAQTKDLLLNITDWDAGISQKELIAKVRELTRKPAIFETKHRRRDETCFDVEVNTCGVQLDGSWYLYASSRDITERKQHEAALNEEHRQLQKALDEVRTLRGIVPICASCKKIRDDNGFWSQVEKYVSAHTEAKFSHGICPDCAVELYPTLYNESGRIKDQKSNI